jgi:hypothetical protein
MFNEFFNMINTLLVNIHLFHISKYAHLNFTHKICSTIFHGFAISICEKNKLVSSVQPKSIAPNDRAKNLMPRQ